MRRTSDIVPTRQSLLSRLKDWNDHDSWKVFFDTYWRLIYHAAILAGLNDAEAQDVVQETVMAVSKHIPEFVYDPSKGSFKTWLMRQTSWRIRDQLRRRMPIQPSLPESGTSTRTATVDQVADPGGSQLEAIWDAEWEANLMEAAIQRVKNKVDAKQFQIFHLYVQKKWPVLKITQDLKISTTQVYLAKHRVGALITKELKCLSKRPI
jgi:RNA polymerase sigma-70 factor (ECF subfamily)